MSNNNLPGASLYSQEPLPDYADMCPWENLSAQLMTEYRQATDEGYDLSQYEGLFCEASKMQPGILKEKLTDVLEQIVKDAPMRADFPYDEPSELEAIKALRDGFTLPDTTLPENLDARIYGAWAGRCCGCLLGKPVEGIHTEELIPLLKASGNYPMHRYIRSTDITEEMYDTYKYHLKGRCFADTVDEMPIDDDTNYTAMGWLLVKRYGRDFTPRNVSELWQSEQSKDAYCTAERIAFCNFVRGFRPPFTALYRNPFREWIGAQIRGDYFGFINPGDPETAADMAWRDASISHTKNGIYGEMFASAMIAAAAVCDDMETVIRAGLSQIPRTSRLYEAVMSVLDDKNGGASLDDCYAKIHAAYDEHIEYGWCHVIPNAMLCAAALLYGNGDYGTTVCMAVQSGFDTDCNGATVGSVVGIRNGFDAIGREWTDAVCNTLHTSINGVGTVGICDIANDTMPFVKR